MLTVFEKTQYLVPQPEPWAKSNVLVASCLVPERKRMAIGDVRMVLRMLCLASTEDLSTDAEVDVRVTPHVTFEVPATFEKVEPRS